MFIRGFSLAFSLALLWSCSGERDPYSTKSELHIGITKSEPSVTVGGDEAFDRYFSLERTIKLSEDVLIGQIGAVDVDRAGRLLITDIVQQQVILFDQSGRYIRTLSTESCSPGYNWDPLYSKFDPDGGIVVVNNGFLSLGFSKAGECIGTMRKMYMPPLALALGTNDDLYGYYNNRD